MISSTNGQELANLECDGDYYVGGRGGAGGRGNKFFLSNENRAPTVAEKGAKGEYQCLRVELRTMANVGLVCIYVIRFNGQLIISLFLSFSHVCLLISF